MFYYIKSDKKISFYNDGNVLNEFNVIDTAEYTWNKHVDEKDQVTETLTINTSNLSSHRVKFNPDFYQFESFILDKKHGQCLYVNNQEHSVRNVWYDNNKKYKESFETPDYSEVINYNKQENVVKKVFQRKYPDHTTAVCTTLFNKNNQFAKGTFKILDADGKVTEHGYMNHLYQKHGYVIVREDDHKKLCFYKNGVKHITLHGPWLKRLLPLFMTISALFKDEPTPQKVTTHSFQPMDGRSGVQNTLER